jgi:hypothetical protein
MRVLLFSFSLLVTAGAWAETNSILHVDWSKMNSRQQLQALKFTTPAYRKEALRLVVEEANRIAKELNLPEQLPILETNLVKSYISPPRMAQGLKAIGNITTSNYVYFPYSGHGFSLVRTRLQDEYSDLQKNFLWPISQIDTNSAYQLATAFLKSALMDVEALNRDCQLTIRTFKPEGENGLHFVPVYWVSWGKSGIPVASVELFEPGKILRQMHINESEYILRKPLQVKNLDFLLSQTNVPAGTLVK